MDYKLFIIFVLLSFVNVILQTIKSLLTINGSKFTSAISNAIAYGLYTVVVVYTVCNLPLWLKVVVTMITNFFGVYISKWLVDKFSKDKLWKIELTVRDADAEYVDCELRAAGIQFSPVHLQNGWFAFNCYCENQEQTADCKWVAKEYKGKISAYESKAL